MTDWRWPFQLQEMKLTEFILVQKLRICSLLSPSNSIFLSSFFINWIRFLMCWKPVVSLSSIGSISLNYFRSSASGKSLCFRIQSMSLSIRLIIIATMLEYMYFFSQHLSTHPISVDSQYDYPEFFCLYTSCCHITSASVTTFCITFT